MPSWWHAVKRLNTQADTSRIPVLTLGVGATSPDGFERVIGKIHRALGALPVQFALELLEKNRLPTAGLRSKNWDEFARSGAPKLDFVFTVCDNAAGEVCPVWPGQPITAHWGVADPAVIAGPDPERRKAFLRAFTELSVRINLLLALPLEKLDRLTLKRRLDDIGKVGTETAAR